MDQKIHLGDIMNIKCLLRVILIVTYAFYSISSFSKNESGVVILEMPQDLQDFFETADACEGCVGDYNINMEKITYEIVEDAIKRNCSEIENNLALMKDKYKNNKDYSERLTVYDDTIIIYRNYISKYGNNEGK